VTWRNPCEAYRDEALVVGPYSARRMRAWRRLGLPDWAGAVSPQELSLAEVAEQCASASAALQREGERAPLPRAASDRGNRRAARIAMRFGDRETEVGCTERGRVTTRPLLEPRGKVRELSGAMADAGVANHEVSACEIGLAKRRATYRAQLA